MNKIELIQTYIEEMNKVGETIKKSQYKTQFFMDLLGLKRGFFYKKMKNGTFTAEEMNRMAPYLYPEAQTEYDKNIIAKLLDQSEKDYEQGNYKDFKELLSETRKIYGI